ncbi:MAG: NAD(P)H-binding protein, partial [Pseudomonadota bacterium]
AHLAALDAAKAAQVPRFLQLSAICLQKPRLTFQHAKLAFEAELRASGLSWTIVRPTAYFKSLSGQVPRVLVGKPFLVFGDGEMTATKPISDRDLAAYLVDCLADPATSRCVLPVGGPGPAVTPRAQGEMIFAAAGLTPRFRHVSPRLLPTIARGMAMIGTVVPPLAPKAELARIGAYYGTESMLVWDAARRRYDADATPEVGRDRLCDHFSAMVSGALDPGLGAHAVF